MSLVCAGKNKLCTILIIFLVYDSNVYATKTPDIIAFFSVCELVADFGHLHPHVMRNY